MRPIRPPELAVGAGALVLLGASIVGLVAGDDGGGAPAGDGQVAIVDFDFRPDPLQTTVGQVVTWTNQDSATHTVTSDGDGPVASGDLAEGESYEVTFDSAGTYDYFCTIHPTMRATVEVSA